MLTTIIASILGFILSVLFLEYFQKLTSIRLQLYGPGLWKIQVLVITLTLLSGLLSGIIIATRIKGTSLADIIKGRTRSQGNITRKIFVGLQFGISGGLLCIMVIIFLQIKFLENINMGFDTNNRLLIKLSPVMANKYEMIRSELQKYPGIKMITGRGSTFGNVDMAMTASRDNYSPETRVFVFGYNVEDDFFKTYGIKLLEGKTFSDFSGTDSTLIMLDKYTAGILGLEHPVGSKIKAWGMTLEVIGLVADADFISLASNRMPRLYTQFSKRCSELTIMYDGDERAVLSKIGKFLAQLDPDYIFTPEKLSDAVRGLYKKEINLIDIISICGIIAVLLSLSGIYAVAQLFARNRIRQNSIRKIFGASETTILIRSLIEIVWPVIAGTLIFWPAAYLIAKQWLTNFGMKINISSLPFISTLVILFVFVLVTVYSVTHKFALKDPAEILRLE
jgi:putative ABC transport system permease protein